MKFLLGENHRDIVLRNAIVAGWTGRDRTKVEHHVKELAELGVAPPSAVPLFYRVSTELFTQCDTIDVLGPDTSGEAEPFLLKWEGQLWLGVASDHTDRKLEAYSVPYSKQGCAKPVASSLWAFDDVEDHLDQLQLQSWIREKGDWVQYQLGTLAHIMPLADLIQSVDLAEGDVMLCGTLPTLAGIRPSQAFRMELADPLRGRQIAAEYAVHDLPVVV